MVKTLRLQEGNHVIRSMNLSSSDRLLAFIVDNANDSIYASLKKDEILSSNVDSSVVFLNL